MEAAAEVGGSGILVVEVVVDILISSGRRNAFSGDGSI